MLKLLYVVLIFLKTLDKVVIMLTQTNLFRFFN